MKVFIFTDISINFSIANKSFNWCTFIEENLFKLLQGCEDFRISNRTTQRRQEWPPNLHPWESATLSDLVLSGKQFFSLYLFLVLPKTKVCLSIEWSNTYHQKNFPIFDNSYVTEGVSTSLGGLFRILTSWVLSVDNIFI